MKLRGAFDPKIQIGVTIASIVAAAWLVVIAVNPYVEPHSARLDARLIPVAFLLGIAVGTPVGIWRLRALRKAMPEVGDQFFLTQSSVIARFREGANATTLQRAAMGWAFIVWFALTTLTNGHVVLIGSLGWYILGQFLAGQTIPFIRVWLGSR